MDVLEKIFGFHQHDLEWYQMAVRAVLMFFVALVFIRIAGMRAFGTRTPFDVVLTITIGALLSRCISGHYPVLSCLAGALALSLTHRIVAHAAYRSKKIRKMMQGSSVVLYENGKWNEKNLKRCSVHDDDIHAALRQQGLKDFGEVEAMWFEINGSIAIVKKQ
jgi:uncharacterized membrane protein YcaP (DUF421 family)